MRSRLVAVLILAVGACGGGRNDGNGPDADTGPHDACVGLECAVVNCAAKNMPPTTISGTVFAPNGTLALFGATVYVPQVDPGAFTDGVTCGQCVDTLPGSPIVFTQSDEAGKFSLQNVPSGTDIPFFVTMGKWRRKVVIPSVTPCQDNPLPPEITRLPRNKTEGDIPKIAISTGGCDALECLLRKLGVSDSEFTTNTGMGRINLFNGNGASGLSNNTMLPSSTELWGSLDTLKNYDEVLFSCECSQNPTTKPQAAMDNLKMYADLGGRIFLSHYHNVWIGGESGVPTHAPAVWPGIATWSDQGGQDTDDIIDQVNNPKGMSFAKWMVNVQGSTSPGVVPITEGRETCTAIDNTKAERWIYQPISGIDYPQNFQFTTPNEAAKDARCGKVVFSDMHVASGSTSSGNFPSGCSSAPLTPQEKALAFMLFDIATCVQVIQ